MANVSSNMIITDESLSQISREILGQEDTYITFTSVLVGDGKYPLVDASGPILNHIYEFPVMEVTRTNNNILLTATIDESAYLTIKEIALYCKFQNGSTHMFSKISGLSVAKSSNLAYNLIIQAKLDINVVNTVAFPEIKVKELILPKYTDFDTVQKVYAYATENLERMIKTNALGVGNYIEGVMTEHKPVGVGYNKAQTYCLLQDKISRWEENFCATFDFANIKKKFSTKTITKRNFNKNLLSTYGNAEVFDDGTGRVLSTSNITIENETFIDTSTDMSVDAEVFISNKGDLYVNEDTETVLNSFINRIEPATFTPIDFTKWNFTVGFTTGNSLNNEETVLNFSNETLYQPLVLGLRNDFCYLKLGGIETLQTHLVNSDKNIFFTRNTNIELEGYYAWTTQSEPIENIHGTIIGALTVDGSTLSNFTTDNYLEIKKFLPSTNSWSVEFTCVTGDIVEGTLFAFGKKTANGIMGITCDLGENITINLSTNGETVNSTLTSTSIIASNTAYNIVVTFDGALYQLIIDGIPEATLALSDAIYNDENCVSYVGVNYTNSSAINPFVGEVELDNANIYINNEIDWEGYYRSQTILLKNLNPALATEIYDEEGYKLSTLIIDRSFGGELANANLFKLLPNTKYLVKATFDGHKYTVQYSQGGKFKSAFLLETSESIERVKKVIIGSLYSALIDTYSSPYSDILNLDDFDISFYRYNSNGTLAEKTNYNFTYITTYTTGKDLLDYFYFPSYHYSYYKIKNLGYENVYSYIDAYEGYLKGNEDKIDFSSEKGFTLYVNTYVPKKDSLIMAKEGGSDTSYFTLKKEENYLIFDCYLTSTNVVSVKGELKNLYTTVDLPVSIFITISSEASPTMNMYINNELVGSKQLSQHTELVASNYYLTNVQEGNEYIKVLAGFNGVLTTDEMSYINRVLDTTL